MKSKLRKLSLEKRKTFSVEENSNKILENLFSLDEYKKAKNILCYYPLKYEVQTFKCFLDKNKNWFLPRVNGENLEVCPYEEDSLQIGSFKILEPSNRKITSLEKIDMIIMPAVAADVNGYRIGYGKGFYDRFLSSLKHSVVKVILVYSDLVYDTVYPTLYDEKVDIIITDKDILKI